MLGVVSGGSRPFRSARVYSGPTEGVSELSLRVEVGERDHVAELPVGGSSFNVVAVQGGQRVATARGRTDQLGSAEVQLRLPKPSTSALELWVEPTDPQAAPLARGIVFERTEPFRAAARRRGGFQSGRNTGEIELAVAPAHGVLVTTRGSLEDEVVVRALRAGMPVVQARINARLEGGEPAVSRLLTDAQGLGRLKVRPVEATLRIALVASADGGGEGTLAARLEVVQGAIRAVRRGETLLIESGGAASHAYLGFFDEYRRYVGLSTPLSPAPDGRLLAEVPWPKGLSASPLWVVASSQADLASPSAVGWPVVGAREPDPQTFDVHERLLLDGAPAAKLREERRARRVRLVTAGYAVAALLLTLTLFVRRLREADRDIEGHLSRSGVENEASSIVPVRNGRSLLAAFCIGLGFVVLVTFALLKE